MSWRHRWSLGGPSFFSSFESTDWSHWIIQQLALEHSKAWRNGLTFFSNFDE